MDEHVDGFDLTFNVRPRVGLYFQGGANWERWTTDNCEVAAQLPEILLACAARADRCQRGRLDARRSSAVSRRRSAHR